MQETERHRPVLTEQTLEQFIDGDYPNNCVTGLLGWLMSVEAGRASREKFFEKVNPDLIWTVDEYIQQKLVPRFGYVVPEDLKLDRLQPRIEKLAELTQILKDQIRQRASLHQIYATVRRFGTEAGIQTAIMEERKLPEGV